MTTLAEADAAKRIIRGILDTLLGPTLPGVNAFGVAWDRLAGRHVVRVDVEADVEPTIGGALPDSIGDVAVQVKPSRPAVFE